MTDNKELFDEIDRQKKLIEKLAENNKLARNHNLDLMSQVDKYNDLKRKLQEIVDLYYVQDDRLLIEKLKYMLGKK